MGENPNVEARRNAGKGAAGLSNPKQILTIGKEGNGEKHLRANDANGEPRNGDLLPPTKPKAKPKLSVER